MDHSVYLQALKAARTQLQKRLLIDEQHMLAMVADKSSRWRDAAAELIAVRHEVAMFDRVIASEEQARAAWAAAVPEPRLRADPAAAAGTGRSGRRD